MADTTAIETKGSIRIAVDIGGTFTDLAAFDEVEGKLLFGKALSTHGALVEGIQNTMDGASVKSADAYLFLHGSTIAINTLLERNGAKTALLITEGFPRYLRNRARQSPGCLQFIFFQARAVGQAVVAV